MQKMTIGAEEAELLLDLLRDPAAAHYRTSDFPYFLDELIGKLAEVVRMDRAETISRHCGEGIAPELLA